MATKKRLAMGSAAVVLLGLAAIVLIEQSDEAPTLRIAPSEEPAAPVVAAPVPPAGTSTTPEARSAPPNEPASTSIREREVPWDEVELLSGRRPSDSPWSELLMDLTEQLRGAIEPCNEAQARRYAGGIVDARQGSPSLLKLHLEAPVADRIVVTGMDRAEVGGSPSEYVRCVVQAVSGYETPAAGMPAGHRMKLILQIH